MTTEEIAARYNRLASDVEQTIREGYSKGQRTKVVV